MKNYHVLLFWLLIVNCFYTAFAHASDLNIDFARTAQEKEQFWRTRDLVYAADLVESTYMQPLDLLAIPEAVKLYGAILCDYADEFNTWRKSEYEAIQKEIDKSKTDESYNHQPLIDRMQRFKRPHKVVIGDGRLFPIDDQTALSMLRSLNITEIIFEVENDQASSAFLDGLSLRNVPEVNGIGVFAEQNYSSGEVIGAYYGEVYYWPTKNASLAFCHTAPEDIDSRELFTKLTFPRTSDQRYSAYLARFHPYFMVPRDDKEGQHILLIDATKHRNEIAYINHSARFPNSAFARVLWIKLKLENGVSEILSIKNAAAIIATKDILVNDQVLMNYRYSEDMRNQGELQLLDLKPNLSCYTCNKIKSLKKCDRCKVARYCSVDCQRPDWPLHREFCFAPKK